MKRGRKSAAELAALAKRPADLREPWQIEQAARCGCKGTDDLCPCQNENPWPREPIDWKARAEAAESSRDDLLRQLEEAKGEVERLKRAGDAIELKSTDRRRTIDGLVLRLHETQAAHEKAEAQRDALLEAGKQLSFAAQTSGGVAGRDEGVVAAIDGFARAIGEIK